MAAVVAVLVVEHLVAAAIAAKLLHLWLRNEFEVGQFAVPIVVVAVQLHPAAAAAVFVRDHDLRSPPVK